MNKAQILYDLDRRDVLFCKSCGQECQEQLKCEACKKPGCDRCLKENTDGQKLCENCTLAESDPQIQAAQKAAASGSYHDLHKYVEKRKQAS